MDAEIQALVDAAMFTMTSINICCWIYIGKTLIRGVEKIIDFKNLEDSNDINQQ